MRYLFPVLVFLMYSCGSEGAKDKTMLEDIEFVEPVEEVPDSILTIQGALDETEEYFYIYVGDEISDQEALKEVHIVPEVWKGYDSTMVQEWMQGIAGYDFDLMDDLPYFTGEVKVYYDATKTKLATSYNVIEGYPDGKVILYDINQQKVIERTYTDYDIASVEKDVFGVMWSLEKEKSNLVFGGAEQFMEMKDTMAILSIGPSSYFFGGSDNTLVDIVEKETFKNTFTLNDEPFSGRLLGFNSFIGYPLSQYFELNFKEGWLHDTIRIWNDWGALQLEERFVDGELVETLYMMEEDYGDGMAKPIIYCYPEKTTNLNVQLKLDGELTHSYPKYPINGWNVQAEPDGTLLDENGKEFYALFWEGKGNNEFTYPNGFVIAGWETAEFLEKSLPILGLNARERNEFIIYWLPLMENNPYNLIRFASTEYEQNAALKVTPEPDTYIRVMMIWSPLVEKISVPVQDLELLRKKREGFTVVEWGGKKQPFENLP